MIEIRVIKDLKTAEALWRKISPRQVIFDDWDFRYGFFKHEPYPLCFQAAYEVLDGREELIGLMPLQANNNWGGLEFFAEEPCEENRVFIKSGYETVIKQIYDNLQTAGKVQIFDISGEDEYTISLPLEDYKYVLSLAKLSSFADFLSTRLTPKRSHSLVKELMAISDLRPEVVLNDFTDLETLFKLNIANFAAESYLTRKEEQEPWRELIKNPLFDWHLTSLRLNSLTIAVSLAVLYNGHWHYLITGADFKTYPGLGKYLTKINIEEAIKSGADYFDAGLGDCGWKHLWHFNKIPQYEFKQMN